MRLLHDVKYERSSENTPRICALCRQPVTEEGSSPTTSGEVVHIACADQQATNTFRARTFRALVTAIVLSTLVIALMSNRASGWYMVMCTALVISHLLLNRRWWTITYWRIRVWIRTKR